MDTVVLSSVLIMTISMGSYSSYSHEERIGKTKCLYLQLILLRLSHVQVRGRHDAKECSLCSAACCYATCRPTCLQQLVSLVTSV